MAKKNAIRAEDLTRDQLLDRLNYDQQSGAFTWRNAKSRPDLEGKKAGYVDAQGYVRIQLRGVDFAAHRLAWFYMTGNWPQEIDHINGERSDNRWQNLREADRLINTQNRVTKASSSGYVGVSRYNKSGMWKAQIAVNRQKFFLGSFADPKDAHDAYLKAKADMHVGFIPSRFKDYP
jgi:hypothetical protein